MNRKIKPIIFLALASCMSIGCGDDLVFTPIAYPADGLWNLRLNHHAIQLSLHAPYDTVHLTALPYAPSGDPWSPSSGIAIDSILAMSPVTWESTDSTKVRVSSDGLVSASAVSTGTVYVIARRQILNVTHTDSARVYVSNLASPPRLDTFRVRPNENDSSKVAVNKSKSLVVTLKDSLGASITGMPVYLRSLDSLIVDISGTSKWATSATRSVSGKRPGATRIVSEAWIYGISKADTFMLTIGYPIDLGTAPLEIPINVGGTSAGLFATVPPGILDRHIGPGGVLIWMNGTSQNPSTPNGVSIDIIFDDTTQVLAALNPTQNSGGGNMLAIPGDTTLSTAAKSRYRRFLTPGVYRYQVFPLGLNGNVIVHDQ